MLNGNADDLVCIVFKFFKILKFTKERLDGEERNEDVYYDTLLISWQQSVL